MTTGTVQKGPLLWLGLMVLVVLFGLCTIFASVVTAAQAWQEHAQARWPEVTARVDECGLKRTSTGGRGRFYIHCRLTYMAGTERNVANLCSGKVPSPDIPQYPPNQIGPFEQWVDQHPPGTPIVVHYDPADHTRVVTLANYMLFSGPRTPNNLKLLEFLAGSFLALLTITRITWLRSFWQSRRSSMPLNP